MGSYDSRQIEARAAAAQLLRRPLPTWPPNCRTQGTSVDLEAIACMLYIHVCICIYIYMYVYYIHMYMYVYMHLQLYIYIENYTYTFIHVYTLRDLDPQQKLTFQLLIRILGNRN